MPDAVLGPGDEQADIGVRADLSAGRVTKTTLHDLVPNICCHF